MELEWNDRSRSGNAMLTIVASMNAIAIQTAVMPRTTVGLGARLRCSCVTPVLAFATTNSARPAEGGSATVTRSLLRILWHGPPGVASTIDRLPVGTGRSPLSRS